MECARAANHAGLEIGHIGHLSQVPKYEAEAAAAFAPDYWTVFNFEKANEAALHSGCFLSWASTYGQSGVILNPLARASPITCSIKAIAAPVPRMPVGASEWSALISVGLRTVRWSSASPSTPSIRPT